MTYKWVVKNRAATIRKLADLCAIALTPEVEALVLERTTRDFMSDHEHLFDDAMVCAALEQRAGLPAAGDSTKVQKTGSTADNREPFGGGGIAGGEDIIGDVIVDHPDQLIGEESIAQRDFMSGRGLL